MDPDRNGGAGPGWSDRFAGAGMRAEGRGPGRSDPGGDAGAPAEGPPQPNARQWEAVRAVDRHVLVNAGAGTGKTFTVVRRILYLLGVEVCGERIAQPVGLGRIAAITYTNRAAADLKRKLREGLRGAGLRREAYEVDLARIGTIHSFCGEVLRDFALRAGRPPAGAVLEEGEAAALAAEVVHEALLQALEEGSVPGLGDLLSQWSSGEVERWVGRLVGNGGVLQKLNDHSEGLGPCEATLLELANLAAERLYERLDRSGAVDFDRMIVGTRDLIREHEDVRRALSRRIHTLIVDEFQDVDPVQKEIAYLLGEPEGGSAATPRLMLVGDPKQSIYRFRRADVTVWTAVERDFRAGGMGDVVTLEESRRSVAPVLGFVDAVIGPVLDTPLAGESLREFEVPYVALKATREDGPADRAVELLVVPPGEDGKCRKVEELRRADAAAIARRALELRGEGVPWREMAVLLASWSSLETYQGALEAAGIPTYALRGDGFYSRREVVDLIVALEAIRDPRDDRALFGFLRSPMVGVSDEALLRIARAARRPYWDHLVGVDVGSEAELLDRGIDILRRHAAIRDRIRLDSLITSLLNDTGYVAYLSLLEGDGPQALANVRQFRAFAAAAPELSLGDFLRMVREVRERGDRVGDARLYGENDHVVTITSVHSAKGLEWEVVFWADLVRSVQDRSEKLVVGRETMVLGEPDTPAREQPDRWQELSALDSAEGRAEQKRLWYVAATRAKDRLVLSGIPAGAGKDEAMDSPAKVLRSAFREVADGSGAGEGGGAGAAEYVGADGRRFRAVVRVAPVPEEVAGAPVERAVGDPAGLPGALAAVTVPLGRGRHSATELLAFLRCPNRHWLKYIAGIREPVVGGSGGPAWRSAVVHGQIVHDVLERIEEEGADVDRLLEDAIGRWAEDAPDGGDAEGLAFRASLREQVEGVVAHAEYAALAARPGARRELAFLHLHADGLATEGRIDLASPGADGVELLDVKTTRCAPGDVAAHAATYAPQRDVYVSAASALSGTPVSRFAFHFSAAGVQEGTPLDGSAAAAAQARLGAALRELAAGSRELARSPGECRFCGYRAAGVCAGVDGTG